MEGRDTVVGVVVMVAGTGAVLGLAVAVWVVEGTGGVVGIVALVEETWSVLGAMVEGDGTGAALLTTTGSVVWLVGSRVRNSSNMATMRVI
jgi:hypothetical protein